MKERNARVEILKIGEKRVLLGDENGRLETLPRTAIAFEFPSIGDLVDVYRNENTVIIVKAEPQMNEGSLEDDSTPVESESTQSTMSHRDIMYSKLMTQKEAEHKNKGENFVEETRIRKNVFVWIYAFLLGGFGIDRFVRGQVILGILKLLTLGAYGVWTAIDFIIALKKAYGCAFGNERLISFSKGEYTK